MKFDIFSELDAARIEKIKAASKYAQLPRGSILFYGGDVCESVLYLTQGRIKILAGATDETPAQIPLYDFCEGEQCIVNIASALSSSPAIATAQALTDVRGCHPRARHSAPHRRISRVSKDRIPLIYAALLIANDFDLGYQI